jgi:hypothetical protein
MLLSFFRYCLPVQVYLVSNINEVGQYQKHVEGQKKPLKSQTNTKKAPNANHMGPHHFFYRYFLRENRNYLH